MTNNQLFAVDFDAGQRRLTIHVDFAPGSRFAHPKAPGQHPVHDTQVKRLRHLNFFQHECHLEVRVPRLRLPDGKVALIEPDWVGKLAGFTLSHFSIDGDVLNGPAIASLTSIESEPTGE